ncbi:putative signal transducer [Aspergillus saccharolyticus JOP 1030-1]|uniref:YL1-domain-containing protein n=1 Tax=Aspergillus saccharolyticus JOP 1030-1 TaxID=1450539 RepID=A0A319A747_9EURO|nr:YL1-domain-containing protein [Aspergillus saccharolyticus JOP 1030-1]PYH47778.1 YL1-domain-containing protein [Aspergillus saccharolyticus JOP 1030-1]
MTDVHENTPSAEEDLPVESLIQGRAKRSTAGLHMSALLDAAADDDLALLFEEVEDDNEFAVDAEELGGEEDDMRFDSSSDDDDDQGPSAKDDDFEGEQQLQKEERADKKKKRAREDLRYKIAAKRVKIDPTAVSAVPAPRPKKKSERVSWIPTPEEGPTRSSSRRQTMQNKELTHARLKDSEEKRIRLIATMEEAAKRKAQFKPKEMTQAERLAEAERVERHNSKSLNRWEEMEKRKAEERKAKIEALQNRRLEGPVMSYWSGIATWTDGRLTRIGKVEITAKPEKEEPQRKKSKKSDKEGKNATELKPTEDGAAAGPATSEKAPPATDQPESSKDPVAPGEEAAAKEHPEPSKTEPTDSQPLKEGNAPSESRTTNADGEASPCALESASASAPASAEAPAAAPEQTSPTTAIEASNTENVPKPHPVDIEMKDAEADTQVSDKPPQGGEVEVAQPAVDAKEPEATTASVAGASQSSPQASKDQDLAAKHEGQHELNLPETQPKSTETTQHTQENPRDATKEPVSEPLAAAGQVSETVAASEELSPTAVPAAAEAPSQADPQNIPVPTLSEKETLEVHASQPHVATQAEVPQPPPVIEHTGRNLTILENFDDKTAQSREFSIYFNAKKPPRLTKISSSLCVITSLPSRYRDPDTSLPFANAYAYHEIRNAVSQKFSWSPMLGCYVGPAGVAARGVPARFLGGPEAKEETTKSAPTAGDKTNEDSPATKADGEVKTPAAGEASTTSKTSTPDPGPAAAPTPTPVASTSIPVASTPAPVASTPAPVASTPAPVASTPAPVVSIPAAVAATDPMEIDQ